MKKRWMIPALLAAVLALTAMLMTGCANGGNGSMKDGYYTAEMSEFSRGWKEYVTICVNGGSIASVEYNALNASGFIKAWDMAYMRDMGAVSGMYPNRYTREYARQLMENQSADGIDTVSGATSSGVYIRLLADAVIRQAMLGDDDVAIVEMPKESSQTATALPVAAAATPVPTTAATPTAMPTTAPTATPAPTPAMTPTAMPTTTPTATPAPTLATTPTAMPTTTPTAKLAPTTAATPTVMPSTTPTATPVPTSVVTPAVMPATTPTLAATPAVTPAVKPAVTSAATRPGGGADAVSSATVKGV